MGVFSLSPFFIKIDMNQASKIVSEALLGIDSQTIFMCGKAYEIKSPTMSVMCAGFAHWSDVILDFKDQTNLSAALQMPNNLQAMLKGVSFFVDSLNGERLYKEWMNSEIGVSLEELNIAVATILSLIDTKGFFLIAQSCLSATKIIAKPK